MDDDGTNPRFEAYATPPAGFYTAEDETEDEEEESDDEEEVNDESNSTRTTLRNNFYYNRSGNVDDSVVDTRTKGSDMASKDVDKEEGKGGKGGESNRSEIDGLFCAICMEVWTNEGAHQICCLPCGHIHGLSCIKKWLQQQGSECPQCNKKCTLKGVRVLYASQLHAVDEELQKKIRSLEARCFSLEKECTDWCKKEVEWRRIEAELNKQVEHLTKKEFQIDGDRQLSGMEGQYMLNKRRCFQGLRALADLHKMRSSATIPGTTPSNHANHI